MTPLQTAMLIKIAENELSPLNGAKPEYVEDATTWADCVIETAEDKGVFTSMINEGLVYHSGGAKADAAVGLTKKGFEAYKSL